MFNLKVESRFSPIIDEYVLHDVSKNDKPTAIANKDTKNTEYVAIVDAGKNNEHPIMYTVRPISMPTL